MPVFRNRLILDLPRGVRAFASLEAGVTRGGAPVQESSPPEGTSGPELRRTQERLQEQNQKLQKLHNREARKDRQISDLQKKLAAVPALEETRGPAPGNLTWIFGIGRSGNTWLSAMMGDVRGHATWSEPCIGELFGDFYYSTSRDGQRRSRNFVLGDPSQEVWTESIRRFVLNEVAGRFGGTEYLAIKEQRGSAGAPLLLRALPESRVVLLVRDPRDVVASNLDAFRREGWAGKDRRTAADRDPDGFAATWAERYVRNVGTALRAYEEHGGPKALVRYEELREDTLGAMKRLYSELGLPVAGEDLEQVVEKHSWENVSREKKGAGKFYRKAQPGSWREDLTPEQAEIVEEKTATLLAELYPEASGESGR